MRGRVCDGLLICPGVVEPFQTDHCVLLIGVAIVVSPCLYYESVLRKVLALRNVDGVLIAGRSVGNWRHVLEYLYVLSCSSHIGSCRQVLGEEVRAGDELPSR